MMVCERERVCVCVCVQAAHFAAVVSISGETINWLKDDGVCVCMYVWFLHARVISGDTINWLRDDGMYV